MTDDHLGVVVMGAIAALFLISCLAMVLTDAPPVYPFGPVTAGTTTAPAIYVNKEHTP